MLRRTILVCLLSLPIVVPGSLMAATKESFLYIQVRQTKLRASPLFWSQAVADLTYGAALVPLGAAPTDKSWIKVKSGETEGYVHVSAITKRKIVLDLSKGSGLGQVDSSDVVLAGKGFNRQVENSYKSSRGIDFASVDEVEQYVVDGTEEAVFLKEGKLLEK